MGDAPPDVQELAAERAARRAVKDFAAADALRAGSPNRGDGRRRPGGLAPGPIAVDVVPSGAVPARDVVSVMDQPATADASIHWVVEGWPQDVRRPIDSFRANAGDRNVHYVVADVTGGPATTWGDDVEVVQLDPGTGWGAARNAGLKRSRGRVVLAMDGSIEATGDVLGPLEAALADPTIGLCGPFGIVTPDLREFDSTDGPEADAIEGYCMAFRREILTTPGCSTRSSAGTGPRISSSRSASRTWACAPWSSPVPVERHEHRMWFQTPPADRAKWSKRNFYRFLDRWRDRYDLTVSGEPPSAHEHHDHGGRGSPRP